MRKGNKSAKQKIEPYDPNDYQTALGDLMEDGRIDKMKNFVQHGSISTYDHCYHVACLCQKLNRRLRLGADEETLLKGAMLHDYFLYDWHENPHDANGWHGYAHADTALRNAKKDFDIGDQIEHVIWSHMWPLNITRVPRSREAWIVCLADKWVSGLETLHR